VLPVIFRGWAVDGANAAVSVQVILGNNNPIPATLGQLRPDIPLHFGRPEMTSASGWSAVVDLVDWPSSTIRVRVLARGRGGNSAVLLDRSYELRDDDAAGEIQAPVDGADLTSEVLVVRGWAIIGDSGIARADVSVNGVPSGRARVRVPHHDMDAETPPKVGAFAGFDYRLVLDGARWTHAEIDVVVTSMKGVRAQLTTTHVSRAQTPMPEGDVERATLLRARSQLAAITANGDQTKRGSGRRLLVFTHELGLGGGQLYLLELLRQLVPGLSACTVVSPIDGSLRPELEQLGIDVVVSGRALPKDIETYEGHVRELMSFIGSFRADVVLLNTLGVWTAADAAERLGTPTLWAIHESFQPADWLDGVYGGTNPSAYIYERLRASIAGATRLIFEAAATSAIFDDIAPADRRMVVPYGVDVNAIARHQASLDVARLRAKHGIDRGSIVLLTVGLYEERKSQAGIVDAFIEVAERHPDAILALVGDNASSYSTALHGLVAQSGYAKRIRLIPATPDVWSWYALADILVSASDIESLPRSMLEAMAFGKPVLSTNVFGIPELVEDGITGWLYEPRDLSALAAAIDRVLLLSPEAREQVGSAARDKVHQRHDSSNYARDYAELIAVLLREGHPDGTATVAYAEDARLRRIDVALSILRSAAESTVDFTDDADPQEPDAGDNLAAFNHLAPLVREGISAFVAAAAGRLPTGARVVDIGAGDAPYRSFFGHADYVTVEWQHSVHPGAMQSDIIASADALPIDDASVDAVIMTEVMEHLGHPARTLTEVARIMRPGAELILTVPFVWILHEMPFDYFRYTPSALTMLLAEAGFSDIKVDTRGDYFSTLAQLMQIVPQWISLTRVADGLDERRALAGTALRRLSQAFAALAPLDAQNLLPLGFNVSAQRISAE
jgi:D-inositol-3-phosphate glycosyltransferase